MYNLEQLYWYITYQVSDLVKKDVKVKMEIVFNVTDSKAFLTLTMPDFLNEIILLTFLALSIISFRDIKMKT